MTERKNQNNSNCYISLPLQSLDSVLFRIYFLSEGIRICSRTIWKRIAREEACVVKKKKAVVRLKDLYTNKEINYMNYSRGYVFKRKLPGRKEFHLRQVTTNA